MPQFCPPACLAGLRTGSAHSLVSSVPSLGSVGSAAGSVVGSAEQLANSAACASLGSQSGSVPSPYGSMHAAGTGSMHPTGRPVLPLDQVDSPIGWRTVATEGNVRVASRPLDDASPHAGQLWLVASDVPAPPATVAAGFRQLVRTWGVHDALLRNISVLSDGGGVPLFVTVSPSQSSSPQPARRPHSETLTRELCREQDCACCFEQVFQATVVPPQPLSPMDFVVRSVWTIHRGQHTAAIRPAADTGSAHHEPTTQRENISVRRGSS